MVFENFDDARNAIQQFNSYAWYERRLQVQLDKNAPIVSGSGHGGRNRGAYSGGSGSRGSSYHGRRAGDHATPEAGSPDPFTDHAEGGCKPGNTIYVQNVSCSTCLFKLVLS